MKRLQLAARLKRPLGAPRRRPEQNLHRAVAHYLRLALRPPVIWTTFPAGGGGKTRGAILKGLGLTPGFPDIMVFAPGPLVLGLELKSKTGRLSPEQQYMAQAFWALGFHYRAARAVEEVEEILRTTGIECHATTLRRMP